MLLYFFVYPYHSGCYWSECACVCIQEEKQRCLLRRSGTVSFIGRKLRAAGDKMSSLSTCTHKKKKKPRMITSIYRYIDVPLSLQNTRNAQKVSLKSWYDAGKTALKRKVTMECNFSHIKVAHCSSLPTKPSCLLQSLHPSLCSNQTDWSVGKKGHWARNLYRCLHKPPGCGRALDYSPCYSHPVPLHSRVPLMPDKGPVPGVILHVIRSLPTPFSRSLSVSQMHISWATGHAQCRLALNPCCCSPALTWGCMTGGSGHSQIINLTRMLFLVLVTVACELTIQPKASAFLRECAGLLFKGQRGQTTGTHQEFHTSGSHLEHSPCV